MKKLKLNLGDKMLTKEQMKEIAGGYSTAGCLNNCYAVASSACGWIQGQPDYNSCYYEYLVGCMVGCVGF